MSEVTKDELEACKNDMGRELEKVEDSVNLIWSELQKLNVKVENLGNALLGGKTDDGK